MKQSELFDFLYRCLLLQNNPELKGGINEKFVSGKVNIDAFVLFASNHLVLPAVYIRLFNTGLIKHFTAEYAGHLKEIYLLNRINTATDYRNKRGTVKRKYTAGLFERHRQFDG